MIFLNGDISYQNKKGKFCKRIISDCYFISYFQTPFLYEYEGELVFGKKGSMLIMEPYVPVCHGPVKQATQGFINDWAYIRGEEIAKLFEKYPVPMNQPFDLSEHFFLRDYIRQLNKETLHQFDGYYDKINCILTQLIIDLHRSYQKSTQNQSADSAMNEVRNAIKKNPSQEWTLEEMAKLSGYSVSRFSFLYKKCFNISPKEDVIRIRIDMAKQLLRYSYSSVSKVAEICGFHSLYYFSKCFKKWAGMSPSNYVKMHILS